MAWLGFWENRGVQSDGFSPKVAGAGQLL
jgi:hypothetical protein